MNVTVAKTAGFCFGVERAVNKVYEEIEKNDGPIYTFGPIIHNEEVVRDLENKGVHVIDSEEELRSLKKGTVIVRSHGVSAHIYNIFSENGLNYVDATCPFVKKIHKIVREESGLARSSRNEYLTDEERAQALGIYEGLKAAKATFEAGERSVMKIRDVVVKSIVAARGVVQYVEVASQKTLQKCTGALGPDDKFVILVAAFFGKTRLIDNMELN